MSSLDLRPGVLCRDAMQLAKLEQDDACVYSKTLDIGPAYNYLLVTWLFAGFLITAGGGLAAAKAPEALEAPMQHQERYR